MERKQGRPSLCSTWKQILCSCLKIQRFQEFRDRALFVPTNLRAVQTVCPASCLCRCLKKKIHNVPHSFPQPFHVRFIHLCHIHCLPSGKGTFCKILVQRFFFFFKSIKSCVCSGVMSTALPPSSYSSLIKQLARRIALALLIAQHGPRSIEVKEMLSHTDATIKLTDFLTRQQLD